MPYREDALDGELAKIQEILAGEPQLRARLRQARRKHDDLEGEVEALIRDQADADEIARRQAELAGLVATEIEITAQLADLPAARAALEALTERRADALRVSDGPLGDDLRALEAAIRRERDAIDAMDAGLRIAERAERAVGDLLDQHEALRRQPSRVTAMLGVLLNTDFRFGLGGGGDLLEERAVTAARIREHVPFVATVLSELIDALGALPRSPLEDGTRALRSWLDRDPGAAQGPDSAIFQGATEVARVVSTVVTSLARARDEAIRRQRELEGRWRTLSLHEGRRLTSPA